MNQEPNAIQPESEPATAGQDELVPLQVEGTTEGDAQKAEEYLKLLQRVQADFVNYKRRVEQEKIEQAKYANVALLQKILPALDDLERAVSSVPESLAGENWVQGVILIERKLRQALESEGVRVIPALGAEFDPNIHEAVIHEPGNEQTDNKVTAVFQQGYKLHDRVIRPAMVKVGGTPEGPWPPSNETERNESEA